MKNLLLNIYILVFAFLLFSCKKDAVNISEDCTITQIKYTNGNITDIRPIDYDEKQRPIKFTENDSLYFTFNYYDSKIVEKTFLNEKLYRAVEYSLINNRIVEAKFSEIDTSGLYRTDYKTAYAYDKQERLIFKGNTYSLSSRESINSNFLVQHISTFSSSYNYVNGNLDTEDRIYSFNNSPLQRVSIKYTYDTSIPNNLPFNDGNFIESYFSGKPNKNIVTKKVLKMSNNTPQETIYSYIFDSSGKALSMTETNDGYSRIKEFTYLCK